MDWVSVMSIRFGWTPEQVCEQRVSDLITVWRYAFDDEQREMWRKG